MNLIIFLSLSFGNIIAAFTCGNTFPGKMQRKRFDSTCSNGNPCQKSQFRAFCGARYFGCRLAQLQDLDIIRDLLSNSNLHRNVL